MLTGVVVVGPAEMNEGVSGGSVTVLVAIGRGGGVGFVGGGT